MIIGGFVLVAVAGLPAFKWLTAGRLHLTEEMNNDIVFFAEAIAVFYSLTVGLLAVGVWSNYSSVSDIVSADAANIARCIATSAAIPNPFAPTYKSRSATTPSSSSAKPGRRRCGGVYG
jgi:hypothetical protein